MPAQPAASNLTAQADRYLLGKMKPRYLLDGLPLDADDLVFVLHGADDDAPERERDGFYRAADVLAPETLTENSFGH